MPGDGISSGYQGLWWTGHALAIRHRTCQGKVADSFKLALLLSEIPECPNVACGMEIRNKYWYHRCKFLWSTLRSGLVF